MVMRSFLSDWREGYVISNSYGMGDPLASRFKEAGRTAEGGGLPAGFLAGITRRFAAGITRPQLLEMTRPGDSESKKRFHHHSPSVQQQAPLGYNL